AAAWGEFIHGAGAGHDDMLMVMAGTGLGGGIISRGRLFRGRFGMAGEIGHYRAVPDGLPCPCGQHGCMEQYASGAAHTRRAREMAAADPARAAVVLALGDGTPDGLDGQHVTKAATPPWERTPASSARRTSPACTNCSRPRRPSERRHARRRARKPMPGHQRSRPSVKESLSMTANASSAGRAHSRAALRPTNL